MITLDSLKPIDMMKEDLEKLILKCQREKYGAKDLTLIKISFDTFLSKYKLANKLYPVLSLSDNNTKLLVTWVKLDTSNMLNREKKYKIY